jgi:flagellar FliJ protein
MSGSAFRFRLERVRALRERREDTAKQALAEALQARERCLLELRGAEDRLAQARAAQLALSTAASTVTDLISHQAFLERAERDIVASHHNLDRHDREVERRRQDLSVAARERQALERLKEARRAEHEAELARIEGIELDEIALNGFRRSAA